ncbi:Hypothetical protein FKW44_003673 [Caligus rogercresseyi]|uniref:Uncharacterized protein n=1 Tax=Caligus rogercresseyi TaxID=217165 RepID=A0A7T8KLY8_CALRO|nr:Hypothetical protein FKW44_003673 [Caligus rogercresseyi]
MLAYKKKPPQILSQAIMNKPLIRGRKIFNNSPKTGRHQFSGQMRKFSRSRPPTTVKMTGF